MKPHRNVIQGIHGRKFRCRTKDLLVLNRFASDFYQLWEPTPGRFDARVVNFAPAKEDGLQQQLVSLILVIRNLFG
jgi:hypothetical protein